MDYIGKSGKGKEATAKAKTPRARTRARTKERAKMERALGKALTKECPCGTRGLARKARAMTRAAKEPKAALATSVAKWSAMQRIAGKESQVEEHTNPGSASSSSTGNTGGRGAASTNTASVKMVRLEAPRGASSLEVFDLTTPRDERSENYPWRVGMVNLIGEDYEIEEFYDFNEFEY